MGDIKADLWVDFYYDVASRGNEFYGNIYLKTYDDLIGDIPIVLTLNFSKTGKIGEGNWVEGFSVSWNTAATQEEHLAMDFANEEAIAYQQDFVFADRYSIDGGLTQVDYEEALLN